MTASSASAALSYFVIGGVYTDTRFAKMAPGKKIERYGPFKTYAQARETWAEHAWRTVDNCHARYRIFDAAGTLLNGPPEPS